MNDPKPDVSYINPDIKEKIVDLVIQHPLPEELQK